MEQLNKLYWGILVIAVGFAGWGLNRWVQATAFMPSTPAQSIANRYSYQKPELTVPLSRYALLQKGEMFFGKAPEPTPALPAPKPEFRSKLLLYGVTKGSNPQSDRAIVGLATEPNGQTWLVKVGTVVAGEMVVKIETSGIWVKNETGKGKVGVRE
ncbi:MAG TPA: hypothetical protein VEC37_13155 [Bacillota bacterium]|nr:hypothetical protein [Bacillota bacterium]